MIAAKGGFGGIMGSKDRIRCWTGYMASSTRDYVWVAL